MLRKGKKTTQLKHLLHPRTMLAAFQACNRKMLVRLPGIFNELAGYERKMGPDEYLARACKLRIVDSEGRLMPVGYVAGGHAELPEGAEERDQSVEALHQIYTELVNVGTSFHEHGATPDDLYAFIPAGTQREVAIPALGYRILHRAVADLLSRRFERPKDTFAHRPGICVMHALAQARLSVRRGQVWAARVDIQKFFPSTRLMLVNRALRAELPTLDPAIRRLAVWLHTANIVRDPRRSDVLPYVPPVEAGKLYSWEPTRLTLLAGTGLAPILSETVAAHLLDRGFELEFAGRARLLRYSDDCLVLASDPAVVHEALAYIRNALEVPGHYKLHETKTDTEPVNLEEVAVKWLGRYVSGDGIVTPATYIAGLVAQLMDHEEGTRQHRRLIRQIHRALTLDSVEVLKEVREWIAALGGEHLDAFDAHGAKWQLSRQRLLNRLNHPRLRRR